jgi:hypothetical protein
MKKVLMAALISVLMVSMPAQVAFAQTESGEADPVLISQPNTDKEISGLHALGRGLRFPAGNIESDFQWVSLVIGSVKVGTQTARAGIFHISDADDSYRYIAREIAVDTDGVITANLYRPDDKETAIGSLELEWKERSGKQILSGTITLNDADGINDGEGNVFILVPSRKPTAVEWTSMVQARKLAGDSDSDEEKIRMRVVAEGAVDDLRLRFAAQDYTEKAPVKFATVLQALPTEKIATAMRVLPEPMAVKLIDTGKLSKQKLDAAIDDVRSNRPRAFSVLQKKFAAVAGKVNALPDDIAPTAG